MPLLMTEFLIYTAHKGKIYTNGYTVKEIILEATGIFFRYDLCARYGKMPYHE